MIEAIKAIAELSLENSVPDWAYSRGLEVVANVEMGSGLVLSKTYGTDTTVTRYRSTVKAITVDLIERKCVTDKGKVTNRTTILLRGSLQKSYFAGTNHQDFYFRDLASEILYLCDLLDISPRDFVLQNLEIGVNLIISVPVRKVIDSALMHGTAPLADYQRHGNSILLGRTSVGSQCTKKLYQKIDPPYPEIQILRFELSFKKMQALGKYPIKTFQDLLSIEKLRSLRGLLPLAWDRMLICNHDIDISSLPISSRQKQLMRDGLNRDFWIRAHVSNRKAFNKKRAEFKQLTRQYGAMDLHATIRQLIVEKVDQLLCLGTILPALAEGVETPEGDTLTTWLTGKSIQYTDHSNDDSNQSDPCLTKADIIKSPKEDDNLIPCNRSGKPSPQKGNLFRSITQLMAKTFHSIRKLLK